MVKFGKHKFKALNKLAKKQNDSPTSNKVIKKKINAEKKVSFQKEILLKQTLKSEELVKKISTNAAVSYKSETPKPNQDGDVKKKLKPLEKQKRRQKTQISDTKLLLSLMKKK